MPHTRPQPTQTSPTVDSNTPKATAEDFETSVAIIDLLRKQDTVSPTAEEFHCDSGDMGFRTRLTDLPQIQSEDIEAGLLVYRPTGTPLHAYELLGEPYTNEFEFREVDTIAHYREHAGENPQIHSRKITLKLATVVDEMTFLQPDTVQQTFST